MTRHWDSGEHDGPEIGSAGLAPSGPVAPRSGRQGRRPRAPSCAYGEYVPASVHMCRCSYSTSDFNIHCRVLTSAHPMQAAWQPMHAWRGAGGPAPDPACACAWPTAGCWSRARPARCCASACRGASSQARAWPAVSDPPPGGRTRGGWPRARRRVAPLFSADPVLHFQARTCTLQTANQLMPTVPPTFGRLGGSSRRWQRQPRQLMRAWTHSP